MRLASIFCVGVALLSTAGCRERGQVVPDVSVFDSAVTALGEKIFPAPERDIVGPTVIAFFPLLPVNGASGQDSVRAFWDLDRQVGELGRALDSLGVRFYFQYSDTVKYRARNVAQVWHAPSDSLKVGYLFLAPGRTPDVQYGTPSNAVLIRRTREWLSRAPDPSK
jgi:hypothetical protein